MQRKPTGWTHADESVTYEVTIVSRTSWHRSDCETDEEWRELKQRVEKYTDADVIDSIFGDVCSVQAIRNRAHQRPIVRKVETQ